MKHKPGTLLKLKNEHKNTGVFANLTIFMNYIAEITACPYTKHGSMCIIDVYFHGANQNRISLYFHRFDVVWEPPESEDKT